MIIVLIVATVLALAQPMARNDAQLHHKIGGGAARTLVFRPHFHHHVHADHEQHHH